MQTTSDIRKPLYHRHAVAKVFGFFVLLTASACLPASPVGPGGSTEGRPASALPAGAFYLRTVDGRTLPLTVAGGSRIESGFVVADSASPGVVGFGESVGRDHSASVRLATGSAQVLGDSHGTARVAAVTWQGAGAQADSVLWSRDSVIVYRTGVAPSVAGAGHRFIYTRATPADTL